MSRKTQADYTDDFREQIVKLYSSGKTPTQIEREYGVTKGTVHNWVKKYDETGSFRDADNRTLQEQELIRLRKENKQLQMENDLLKQVALIMGKK